MKNAFKMLLLVSLMIGCQTEEITIVEEIAGAPTTVIMLQTQKEYENDIQGRFINPGDECNFWSTSYTNTVNGHTGWWPISGWPMAIKNYDVKLEAIIFPLVSGELGMYSVWTNLIGFTGQANGGRLFIEGCRVGVELFSCDTESFMSSSSQFDIREVQVQLFYSLPLVTASSVTYELFFFKEGFQNGCQVFVDSVFLTAYVEIV